MGAKLKLDISKLQDQVREGSLQGEEMGEIVEDVAGELFNAIVAAIPIAKENSTGGWRHFEPSEVRIYKNQAHISLRFDKDWESWKHLYFLNYNPASEHFGWFDIAVRTNRAKAKKLLEAKTKAKIESKG